MLARNHLLTIYFLGLQVGIWPACHESCIELGVSLSFQPCCESEGSLILGKISPIMEGECEAENIAYGYEFCEFDETE